jgi:hypothetical protein
MVSTIRLQPVNLAWKLVFLLPWAAAVTLGLLPGRQRDLHAEVDDVGSQKSECMLTSE